MKLFLVVVLAATSVANPVHYDEVTDEINKVVDEALTVFEKSKSFDPLKVPEHEEKFERHIGILDFKGDLLMKNIEVRGLKQLQRQGDANIKSNDGIIFVHLLLGVHDKNIQIDYDMLCKMGDIHPSVHVVSDIQDFEIEVSLEIEDENITLTSFEVSQFANVVNHIGGISILSPAFSVLSDVLTFVFNDVVREEMTQVLAPAFKREIEKKHKLY